MGKVLPISAKPNGDWYEAISKNQPDGVELEETDRETFNQAFKSYVAESFKQAFKDFHVLAKKGSSNSQYFLGVMCLQGLGTLQDYSQSHMWFNIAASQGHKKARKHLDDLNHDLSINQISEAQKMAREWTEKHLGD